MLMIDDEWSPCRRRSLAPGTLARECDLEELRGLASELDVSCHNVRRAVFDAEVRAAVTEEAEAAAAGSSSSSSSRRERDFCAVCLTERRDTALNCGHLTCHGCAERLADCPICRSRITSRTRVFI